MEVFFNLFVSMQSVDENDVELLRVFREEFVGGFNGYPFFEVRSRIDSYLPLAKYFVEAVAVLYSYLQIRRITARCDYPIDDVRSFYRHVLIIGFFAKAASILLGLSTLFR